MSPGGVAVDPVENLIDCSLCYEEHSQDHTVCNVHHTLNTILSHCARTVFTGQQYCCVFKPVLLSHLVALKSGEDLQIEWI